MVKVACSVGAEAYQTSEEKEICSHSLETQIVAESHGIRGGKDPRDSKFPSIARVIGDLGFNPLSILERQMFNPLDHISFTKFINVYERSLDDYV